MASPPSILDLASTIQSYAAIIHDAQNAKQAPAGSDGPSPELAQFALLEAVDELRAQVMGPVQYSLYISAWWTSYPGLVDVLHKFKIPEKLGLEETVTYAELAARCGLTEAVTRHALRAAISLRYFEEPEKNQVRHNAFSKALVTFPGLMDWMGFCTDDVVPAAAKWAESLQKYPGSESTTESAFSLAMGKSEGYFTVLDQDAERRRRFANGQGLLMAHPARDPIHLVNSLDWSGENCPKTVIDIGGSHGHLMKAILERYPGVEQGVVQDLPGVVSQASVPDGLEGRMSYEAYDFFTEQKRKADVRIFRVILHDWPDADAIKILRNQIPSLEPGDQIILNEQVVEGVAEGKLFQDQMLRVGDLMMHQLFNAKERSKEEWTALFAAADPRFHVESFILIPPAVISTITAVWTG